MRKPWLTLLLGLLALSQVSVFCADDVEDEDYADQERALLVVRKFVKEGSAVQGRNLTVSVSVYNAGSSTALNVEVEDAKLPAAFQLVAGSLSSKFERIPLASNVTHEYVVVATAAAQGPVVLEAATVKYQAELETEEYQVGRSAPTAIYVMTPSQQIQKHLLSVGSYFTGGLCKTPNDWRNLTIFVVVVGVLLGGNWGYKKVTVQKQKWNREKNLKDFGLDSDDDTAKKTSRKARRQTDDKEN